MPGNILIVTVFLQNIKLKKGIYPDKYPGILVCIYKLLYFTGFAGGFP